jgi:hypothetical protein
MNASVLVLLDHGLGSCLSAPISHGQRYVRPTFAILHIKDEHPVHRAATDFSRFPELPLVGSVNDAVHAAIARFGQQSRSSSERFLSQLVFERRYL